MARESIRQSMSILGITQAEVAKASGLSEAAVSRQFSGELRFSDSVRGTALRLIRERAITLGQEILAHYGLSADFDEGLED